VWLSPLRERGDQPGLSLDQIVTATVRLLDADGLAGFSMRRLAGELGAAPMSLYWYVSTKDDLLEMALDEVFGEIDLPEPGGHWTQRLRWLAIGMRDALLRHPWSPRLCGEYLGLGPKMLGFSEVVLSTVGESGLSDEGIEPAAGLVFQYVHGCASTDARWMERLAAEKLDEDEYVNEIFAAARPLVAELPVYRRLYEQPREETPFSERRTGNFRFGLDCLLAGIAAQPFRAEADSAPS
jgi:AcrR family transcriptional regulator